MFTFMLVYFLLRKLVHYRVLLYIRPNFILYLLSTYTSFASFAPFTPLPLLSPQIAWLEP